MPTGVYDRRRKTVTQTQIVLVNGNDIESGMERHFTANGHTRSLTAKQRMFIDLKEDGDPKTGELISQAEAYRRAYGTPKDVPLSTVSSMAYKVAHLPHVETYIAAKRERKEKVVSYDAGKLRQFVQDRLLIEALDVNNSGAVRVSAIKAIGELSDVQAFNSKTEQGALIIDNSAEIEARLNAKLAELLKPETGKL